MLGLHDGGPTLRGKSVPPDDLECKTVARANLLPENIGPWNGLIMLTIPRRRRAPGHETLKEPHAVRINPPCTESLDQYYSADR